MSSQEVTKRTVNQSKEREGKVVTAEIHEIKIFITEGIGNNKRLLFEKTDRKPQAKVFKRKEKYK